MKVLTIVGARPQFIKMSVVSRVLRNEFEEIVIHTGQHYDHNMSQLFFEEMNIPEPKYNLGISGKTHGKMTGEMIAGIEEVLIEELPDMVIVYGDTNSTMAGALASVKLHIPICHVESGGRLGTLKNPEEVNRIVTDHISNLLMACTNSAVDFLKNEGLEKKTFLVGDPMYDAFLYYSEKVSSRIPEKLFGINGEEYEIPKEYYYLTCHRAENTDDDKKLLEVLKAMEELESKCIYPVHPRNINTVKNLAARVEFKNILFCRPVGYLLSVYLVNHSKKIITDSGGLQREAYFAKKPCVTIFSYVSWPETMINKRNQLAKLEKKDILTKLDEEVKFDNEYPFGDGHAAEKIVEQIKHYLKGE